MGDTRRVEEYVAARRGDASPLYEYSLRPLQNYDHLVDRVAVSAHVPGAAGAVEAHIREADLPQGPRAGRRPIVRLAADANVEWRP